MAKTPYWTNDEHDRAVADLTAVYNILNYLCLSPAGLVIGSTSKKEIKIASTTAYLNGGVFCSKTTAEVAFTVTTHDIAPSATLVQEAVYVLSLDAAGTATVTMGAIASGAGNAVVPATPAGGTAIGYVRIAVAAGATKFDATSDDLDAAHLTATYVNTINFPTTGLTSREISLTA